MASQSPPDPMESDASEYADVPELPEDHVAEDGYASEEEYAPGYSEVEPSPSGGGFWSFCLCTSGFFMAAGGVALATAPHFSWQLQKIGRQLSAMGLENGVFVVGGLLLFGLGLVYRATRARNEAPVSHESDDRSDLSLAVESLATDVSLFRDSILQMSSQVAQLGQHQAALHEELHDESAHGTTNASDSAAGERNDAMFRLAASLDQLNARVDERMHHMDVQLRGHFDGVGEAIRESREALDTRMRALSTQMQARTVTTEVPTQSDAPSLSDMAGREDELLVVDPGPVPEEFEIVVELEEPEPPVPDESAIEFFETLEQLDEMVTGATEPAAAPPLDFDGLDLGELGMGDEPPAVCPDPEPAASLGEDALESLLPEDTVRRALDPDHREEQ